VISMSDLIIIEDTFEINIQRRKSDGKPDEIEMCFIYPECMNQDNKIIRYPYLTHAYGDFGNIIRKAEGVVNEIT
jgi:hypothetical protein